MTRLHQEPVMLRLTPPLRQRLRYSVYCDTFQNLEDFARTLLAAAPADIAKRGAKS